MDNQFSVDQFYCIKNKDDNIHKSEALKSEGGQTGQSNNNTCRVSELISIHDKPYFHFSD